MLLLFYSTFPNYSFPCFFRKNQEDMAALLECARSFKSLMNNNKGLVAVAQFPGSFRQIIMILEPPKSPFAI